jgi:hypothetical protein
MTEIFKIQLTNKDLKDEVPPLYFETKEAAEFVISTYDKMAKDGVKFEWFCSVVDVLSKKDAYEQFNSLIEKRFDVN